MRGGTELKGSELKSRLLTLLVMIGLGVGLALLARSEDRKAAPRVQSGRLYPGLGVDGITQLHLELRAGQYLTLERPSGGLWRIVEPGPEVARQDLVDVVLETLATAEVEPLESQGSTLRAEQVGLEPPLHTIRFGDGAYSQTLLLGEVEPLGRMVYARRAGSPEIFLATRSLITHLQSHGGDFVDRSLLRGVAGTPDWIRMSDAAGTRWAARRSGSVWTLEQPLAAPADSARLGILLRSLQFVQQEGVVVSAPSAAQLASLGLPSEEQRRAGERAEALQVELSAPGEPPVSLWFQRGWEQQQDLVSVLRSDFAKVVSVPRAALNLLTHGVDFFRERRLLPPVRERAHSLRIESEGLVLLDIREQEAGRWTFAQPESLAGEAVDTTRFLGRSPLGDLLDRVDSLEAIAFEAPPAGEARAVISVGWTLGGQRRLDRIQLFQPGALGVPSMSSDRPGEGLLLGPEVLALLDPFQADSLRSTAPLEVDEALWTRLEIRAADGSVWELEREGTSGEWRGDDPWNRRYALARDLLRGFRGSRWQRARESVTYPWSIVLRDAGGTVLAGLSVRLPLADEEQEVLGVLSARVLVAGRPGVELVVARELVDRLVALEQPLQRQP
ncbi:MAG: DUF4340 domain-containing protein [Planctomycetota bacterium]